MQVLAFSVFFAALQVFPGVGAKKQGRSGNEHFEAERFEEASHAYQNGLSSLDSDRERDATYYGLQHNLGAALHRQEDFEGAQAAFAEALEHAGSDAEFARAAYNAGNNAFRRAASESALDHYRKALLADPSSQDAKYNYEFIKRQTQEQQQEQQQEQDQEQDQEDQEQENQDQEQQEQQEQEEQQQEQDQEPREEPLSREQAERILQAMENEEEQLLREVQKAKGQPRRVAKDW